MGHGPLERVLETLQDELIPEAGPIFPIKMGEVLVLAECNTGIYDSEANIRPILMNYTPLERV